MPGASRICRDFLDLSRPLPRDVSVRRSAASQSSRPDPGDSRTGCLSAALSPARGPPSRGRRKVSGQWASRLERSARKAADRRMGSEPSASHPGGAARQTAGNREATQAGGLMSRRRRPRRRSRRVRVSIPSRGRPALGTTRAHLPPPPTRVPVRREPPSQRSSSHSAVAAAQSPPLRSPGEHSIGRAAGRRRLDDPGARGRRLPRRWRIGAAASRWWPSTSPVGVRSSGARPEASLGGVRTSPGVPVPKRPAIRVATVDP